MYYAFLGSLCPCKAIRVHRSILHPVLCCYVQRSRSCVAGSASTKTSVWFITARQLWRWCGQSTQSFALSTICNAIQYASHLMRFSDMQIGC
jgi:hypothetical protein